MTRDDYYQEAFEVAMEEAGCGALLAQMTREQRMEVGGGIAGCVENERMAFHVPENPYRRELDDVTRKLKWERELGHCQPCNGTGRLQYSAGPWGVDTGCHHCHGAGKVHPHGERQPA